MSGRVIWVDVLVTAQYNFAEQLGLQSRLNGLIATFLLTGKLAAKQQPLLSS
jgi:hypothetical protein